MNPRLLLAVVILASASHSMADRLSEIGAYVGAAVPDKVINREYLVSKGGADPAMLQKVFVCVADKEQSKTVKPMDFLVSSRIDARTFLVHRKAGSPFGPRPDITTTYVLVADKDMNVADGESITGVRALLTEEIREVDGSKLRVMKIDPEAARLSREGFVTRLKAGEQWTLSNFATESCRKCDGKGKIDLDRRRLGSKITTQRCADCDGKGKIVISLKVKW